MFDQTSVTKLFPQYRQRRTASRRSSTSQFRAAPGSQAGGAVPRRDDKNAFRLHPRQVRTIDVERMKVVMLQRSRLQLRNGDRIDHREHYLRHLCPFGHTARFGSVNGTSA